MFKKPILFFIAFVTLSTHSQDVALPVDLRQHNLTEYNSSLMIPVFSLDRNKPQSLAFWSRWQWQSIDSDPTTLFLNYTRRLNANSAIGGSFFQNNTGTFLNSGAIFNYAYALDLKSNAQIAFGVNLFGFNKKLADTFQPNPNIQLPQLEATNDFILQLAPSLRFMTNGFSIGIVGENLFDYNFSTNERETRPSDKTYIGFASYAIPITLFNFTGESFLQPTVYMKTIPGFDNQFGLTALLSTSKFWSQLGYNNFYGISVGAGGRFFKKFSIGALMEFGTDSSLDGTDPTFEFVTAYNFGAQDLRKKVVGFEEEGEEILVEQQEKMIDEEKVKEDAIAEAEEREKLEEEEERLEKEQRKTDSIAAVQKASQQKTLDSIAAVRKEKALAAEEIRQQKADSVATAKKEEAIAAAEKLKQQQEQDSIAKAKKEEALAVAEKAREQKRLDSIRQVKLAETEAAKKLEERRRDSINKAKLAAAEAAKKKEEADKVAQEEKPREGERYEETGTEDGLEPGYYLIANVFGTQKYFDAFMKDLDRKGLQPKSFLRSLNNYNYVYLKRYETLDEARKGRDTNYNGRYRGETWIFRVAKE